MSKHFTSPFFFISAQSNHQEKYDLFSFDFHQLFFKDIDDDQKYSIDIVVIHEIVEDA